MKDIENIPISFVDLETGGTNPGQDDILEIGIVKVSYPRLYFAGGGGEPELIEEVSIKVNPSRPPDPEAARLNGFDKDVWAKEGKDLIDALTQCHEVIRQSRFAAWNFGFDSQFFIQSYNKLGWRWPPFQMSHRMIDVQTLCWPYTLAHFENPYKVNQGDIAKKMGLPEAEKTLHRAVVDAHLNRAMYEFIMCRIDVTPPANGAVPAGDPSGQRSEKES